MIPASTAHEPKAARGGSAAMSRLARMVGIVLAACIGGGSALAGEPESLSLVSLAPDRARLTGLLTLPEAAKDKAPVMLILHGSAGPRAAREGRYAELLHAAGIATLVLDSFTGRGVGATTTDQSQVATSAVMGDAFAALRALAAHPAIDADRIAVMGFSKGATAALGTAFEPYRWRFGIGPELRFRLHAAAYPWCGLQFRRIVLSGAPILMLLGEADDYTRAPPCIDYARRISEAGGRVHTMVYPGAGHGFDGGEGPPRRLTRAENYGHCFAWIDEDTALIDPATDRRMPTRDETRAFFAKCRTSGGTVGVEPDARRRAAEDLLAFLRENL